MYISQLGDNYINTCHVAYCARFSQLPDPELNAIVAKPLEFCWKTKGTGYLLCLQNFYVTHKYL